MITLYLKVKALTMFNETTERQNKRKRKERKAVSWPIRKREREREDRKDVIK